MITPCGVTATTGGARYRPKYIADRVARTASGPFHSLFLKQDGTLWALGSNSDGQLGDGTDVDRTTPVLVAADVIDLAAGWSHSLFLKSDGTLWGMGNNGSGQLGDNDDNQHAPVLVASDVASFAAGDAHALFLKEDDSLWACGSNTSGQLGGDGESEWPFPKKMTASATRIASGERHILLLSPEAAPPVFNSVSKHRLASPGQHATLSVSIRGAGVSIQWYRGEAGDTTRPIAGANTATFTTPEIPGNADYWVRVTNAYGSIDSTTFSLRTIADARRAAAPSILRGFGRNVHGALGIGTKGYRTERAKIDSGVAAVAAGYVHSLYLKTDGTLWAMGLNAYQQLGQLGDGSTDNRSTPVQIAEEVVSFAAGSRFSIFVKSDGT
ncbi:MAG: RCC1 domain-containing protein, partial [Opitutaceae bacterium]